MWYFHTFSKYIAPPKGQPPVKSYEMYTAARDWLAALEWDAVVRGGAVVCGSPDQVAERIAQIHELCGITHYLAWTRIGGLAHQKVLRSMELMRDRVMPQLRPLGGPVPAGRAG
jgi:alkanesulfonate monooxygenase SsuD/methylene tetrahydromethanopterin reductase-like flavin-dependent oxidoreductase (luciferase family)